MKLLSFFLIFLLMPLTHAHNLGSPIKFAWSMKGSIKAKNYHQTMDVISHLGIEVAGVDYHGKIIDVLLSDSEYDMLSRAGVEVELNEVKSLWANLAPDSEYKNPEEIESFMRDFHHRYPDISKLVVIGKSIEGRDIFAMKISDHVQTRELSEPTILFNSMHHAREIMTPEVSVDIIEYLLTNYGIDGNATRWVNNNEIWVVPMLNVDGNNKVWNGNSMWRKNTRNGHGVDLNRNYPFSWDACNGSSGSTWSGTYRGKAPGSEPETQALMKLVSTIKPVFDISYHAYSEMVLYPYGCGDNKTETAEVVEGVGQEIASLLGYTAGTPWELLYNADGGDIDWMYAEHQVIPFVIELNSRSEGFHPRYARARDKTVELNRKGWMYLLDRLEESGVRGVMENYDKNNENTIKVFNEDNELVQTYRINPDGTFHIVLNPGEYRLKINSNRSEEKILKVKSDLINLGGLSF